jgi:hypothetical protein
MSENSVVAYEFGQSHGGLVGVCLAINERGGRKISSSLNHELGTGDGNMSCTRIRSSCATAFILIGLIRELNIRMLIL